MKKLIAVSVLLVFLLAACGASTATQTGSSPSGNSNSGELSTPAQYAIGILKLEGTPQAVTAEQAAELLPLWQVYQSLSTSDNAAQEEIDALVTQIQDTMTADQTKAINDMGITSRDMFSVMQEMGVTMSGGPRSPGSSNGSSGGNDQGGFPGGGPPPDMGGGGMPGGGGQGLSREQIATAQAARGSGSGMPGGNFNGVPSALLDALIKYLQEVAGS